MPSGVLNPPAVHPSRPADLRQSNCRTLLRLLQAYTAVSRADLVRLSGLSAPTVTAAVQSLEKAGLVEILGEGQSSGGRPPELLRFNAAHGFVVAVDIGGTNLRLMLADLAGTVRAEWKGRLQPTGKHPEAVCRLVHEGIEHLCTTAGIRPDRILHMTVGAPGITDVARGLVISAPNLIDWNNIPLQDLLAAETGISALIENDTNLAALGEHHQGAAARAADFVFIAIGTGVGAGIFLRGELHHGATWSAGEIGYLGVPNAPRQTLDLQATGQLERLIGGTGIEQQWQHQLTLSGQTDAALTSLRGSQIFDHAATTHSTAPAAHAVLLNVATLLADAISTITLLFNPSLVVLGGGVGSHPALRTETERILAVSAFPHPTLRTSKLGSQAQLHGAVALSLLALESRLFC